MTASLRPADTIEIAAYLPHPRDDYIAERVRAGDEPGAAARDADQSIGRAFPDGRPAGANLVFRVLLAGEPAGFPWTSPQAPQVPAP